MSAGPHHALASRGAAGLDGMLATLLAPSVASDASARSEYKPQSAAALTRKLIVAGVTAAGATTGAAGAAGATTTIIDASLPVPSSRSSGFGRLGPRSMSLLRGMGARERAGGARSMPAKGVYAAASPGCPPPRDTTLTCPPPLRWWLPHVAQPTLRGRACLPAAARCSSTLPHTGKERQRRRWRACVASWHRPGPRSLMCQRCLTRSLPPIRQLLPPHCSPPLVPRFVARPRSWLQRPTASAPTRSTCWTSPATQRGCG